MKKHPEDPGIHLMVGFDGLSLGEELRTIVKDFRIGGIVLFCRNITSPDQLRALLDEARRFSLETLGRPLWVAVDQEGGPVQRLCPPFTQLPPARRLGTEGAPAIRKWQTIAAREMRDIGVHINFAPVLDLVPNNQPHFMEARSLGSDPEKVGELGAIWIQTLQTNGVSATAKHYPGLGRAELDPHHFAPVIHWQDHEAMENDLVPFQAAVRAGAHCVMTSHARYPTLDPDYPATLSEIINRELLRERLGFEGILFSDDMDMAAVSERYSWDEMVYRGLVSSIDFFLLCQNPKNIEPFYRSLHQGISGNSDLQDLHRFSVNRIGRLLHAHENR